MKICLGMFDAKRCRYGMAMSWKKEDQVKVCKNSHCDYASVTERTINGETVLIVTCDFTWNPFDNREVTAKEYHENYE